MVKNKAKNKHRKAQVIKIRRSADEQYAEVKGSERIHTMVKTRMTKKEFEASRDYYNEIWAEERKGFGFKNTGISSKSAYGDVPDYADYASWGQKGGKASSRKKWDNSAERMKATRIVTKLSTGKLLKDKDRDFLKSLGPEKSAEIITKGIVGHKGRPRKYHVDRSASPAERQRAKRAREKENLSQP